MASPSASSYELLQRQVQELEALALIYGEEGQFEAAELEAASERLAAGPDGELSGSGPPSEGGGLLSCSIKVGEVRDEPVWLQCVLPERYPEVEPLCFLGGGGEGGGCDAVAARVASVVAEEGGQDMECLLSVAQAAADALAEMAEDEEAAAAAAAAAAEAEAVADAAELEEQQRLLALLSADDDSARRAERAGGAEQVLGRRCCYSHHIIAPGKRQAVTQWAVQLGLAGLAKIGWPGVIIVEGPEPMCVAYVDALQRLRWKHFVVRGEEQLRCPPERSLDSLRRLPLGFREYGPDGMREMADECRRCGLEELFLTCMKRGGRSGGR